jgi:phosphate transport system substrate-binding protein
MKTTLCSGRFDLTGMRLTRGISLICLSVFLAGCPASNQAPEPRRDGTVIIRGSNTIGEELAPRLIAEYKKDHSSASFDLETKGTAYGMGALLADQCDIAGASRLPSKDEQALAQFRSIELNDDVIGSYSVAVVVNAGNPVGNLTKDQVRDIFTGAIANWKEVGGPDAPIHLCVRDPVSGTHIGFRELAMENKPYAGNPKMSTNYAGIVQAVAQDPNAIGYSSFQRSKSDGVKVVSIGGVEAIADSVNKGTYPYARTLHLYTNKQKEAPAAHDFIQFVQSSRGQEVMAKMGYVSPHQ